MTEQQATVLLVAQEDGEAASLGGRVEGLGYVVCGVAACGSAAIMLADETSPDLVLVEVGLDGNPPGVAAAAHIGHTFGIPVVFVFGAPDPGDGDVLRRAAASNPCGYLHRPFSDAQLDLTIRTFVGSRAVESAQRAAQLELRRRVASLEMLNQRMRTAFDFMSEGVIAIGENRALLFHNANARRMCGDDICRWIQECSVHRCAGGERFDPGERSLAAALNGNVLDGLDLLVGNPDRPDKLQVRVSARPVSGAHGGARGTVIVLRDITGERRLGEKLTHTARHLERQTALTDTIFSCISHGVVVADGPGRLIKYNAAAERILGSGKLVDLTTKPECEAYGAFLPDRTTRVTAEELPLERAMKGESTDNVEVFVRNAEKPDGVFVNLSGRPLIKDGFCHGAVVVVHDVTKEKATDDELRHTMTELRYQGELLDTAFRSISDGIVVASADGKSIYANPAAERVIGLGIADAPPETWAEKYGIYYPDRETPIATEDIPRAIQLGEWVGEEDLFIRNRSRPNGGYINVTIRPLPNDVGATRGAVLVIRDVTERVLAAEALNQAFAEGRLEIVDTIVHNVGNAITSVTTGIETLRRALADDRFGRHLAALADAVSAHQDNWLDYLRDDPQGRKVLPFLISLSAGYARRRASLIAPFARVRESAQRIAEMVSNYRLLGNAADRKDIDLNEAISVALRLLRDSLAANGINATVDSRHAPQQIRVRESYFNQMLINLIKNAIEAIGDLAAEQGLAEPPWIRIRACRDGRFLSLEIADNGIGLKTKDYWMLISPGYTTKPGGSGLGLHSVARFVIASGGRLRPESQGYGKGTTMRVVLPLSSVSPQGSQVDAPLGTADVGGIAP